jgi:hypothetical protein
MRMKARFVIPQINVEGYKEALNQQMFDAVLHGAFAYLDAVTQIVPVWSGASRATFLQLAREVGYPLVVSGQAQAPSRVPLGIAESTGDFSNDPNGIVKFIYATTLKHLVYNEYNNANETPDDTLFAKLNQPGPYHFQEAGKQAFLRAVTDALPRLEDFITVKSVQVK